jgi:hypothetical protein
MGRYDGKPPSDHNAQTTLSSPPPLMHNAAADFIYKFSARAGFGDLRGLAALGFVSHASASTSHTSTDYTNIVGPSVARAKVDRFLVPARGGSPDCEGGKSWFALPAYSLARHQSIRTG